MSENSRTDNQYDDAAPVPETVAVTHGLDSDGTDSKELTVRDVIFRDPDDGPVVPIDAPKPIPGIPRYLSIVIGAAALLIILIAVQGAKDIIAPVFLGLNLLIVVYPLQRWLATKIQRHVAAAIALVVVLLVLGLFVGLAVWSVTELIRELPQYNAQFTRLVNESYAWLESIGISSGMIESSVQGITAGNLMSLVTPILSNVTGILSMLATLIMGVFFFSMDSASIIRRLTRVAEDRPHIAGALIDFAHGVRRYWVVTTIFGLIVAVLDVMVLGIIGVHLVWVWGVLAFITNYIPNIGFVIGLVPPALLALLDGGWIPALAVVISYSVLNFTVQSIIQPKFTGESVGVTPTVSFLSLMFWVIILGWLGALIALPATLLLKALLVDADPSARWINALISSKPQDSRPRSNADLLMLAQMGGTGVKADEIKNDDAAARHNS
ncbi:AI-2E family transporter [Neomicrococcus lactis]|uniref:AI-2E family transporter n=1 Tax=Neomicrococcus lactis TaxID=732241 RepID=UPI0023006532|nr:AI-2E family transporter [Neomicrococcus lactis]